MIVAMMIAAMKAPLSRPVLETCGKADLKRARGFGNLRIVADDHFVCDAVAPNQVYARERLSTAERSIRFMEHTGLRPSKDRRKAYPGGSMRKKCPARITPPAGLLRQRAGSDAFSGYADWLRRLASVLRLEASGTGAVAPAGRRAFPIGRRMC